MIYQIILLVVVLFGVVYIGGQINMSQYEEDAGKEKNSDSEEMIETFLEADVGEKLEGRALTREIV